MLGCMTTSVSFDKPVDRPAGPSGLRCTHADRDRVVDLLKDAYAEGRLDQAEFDARFDQAMHARTYVELDHVLVDLVPGAAPVPVPGVAVRPRLAPPTREERLMAALAQATTYVPILVGPAIVMYTAGKRSEFVRHHAAGALNLQLTLLVLMMVTFGLGSLALPVVWLFAMVGVVVALSGRTFRYPWTLRVFGRRGPYPT